MKPRKLKRKKVENWILINKKFLKIKAIEREVNIPANTIQKYIKNGVLINGRKITRIYNWILKLAATNDNIWIFTHYKYLNIRSIEREIKTQKGTIQKHIKYKRRLNDKTTKSLQDWQNEFLSPIEEWKK